ncbi:unnamed protein product [Anisakis simplex]|uniref:Putative methionine synthase reductase (inferred by orthology to a C. elegans protein) n=1 Tax=Anisakis simplex TaxID=6269 RepID=A0A0M3JNJ6_ANISI|nr:unnamed protein product [Anisakis simplex]
MGGDPASGRGYDRFGVATDYLRSLRVGDVVKVILKESGRFRLPTPSNTHADVRKIPLIMIGPGTGVAPFLAFLQKIL